MNKYNIQSRKLTFINKANLKFNFKFDYSEVIYLNNHTKVVINCPEHGKFEQTPMSHLSTEFGCKDCSFVYKISNLKPFEEFIEQVKLLHPTLDFSQVKYRGNKVNVLVRCPIHGEFNKNLFIF